MVLLAHTTSNFILFFRNLLEFFFINQLLFSILEFILISANYYTQPIVILALLERLAATVFVSNYEKSCQWVPYICGQFICVSSLFIKPQKRARISDCIRSSYEPIPTRRIICE